jgi:pimeloyl-ACP methyl ester carboxylesterase
MQTLSKPLNPTDQPELPGEYWQWRGQAIYYVHAGQSQERKPSLLLIHGFGASTDHWRKTIQDLQQDYDVWAIDLLGFGRAAKPNWTYSTDLWREQIQDFIQSQIQSPVVLAGNSLGGYVSLCVAAACDRVCGVVLLNSAGRFSNPQPTSSSSPIQQVLGKSIQAILKQPWAKFLLFQYLRQKRVIRGVLRKVYVNQAAVTDRLVEEIYRPSCDRGAADVFASVFTSPSGKTADDLLQAMQCPLLLLWGEKDPWMNTRKRSEQFHQHYTNITEHFLEAGHCPHDDAPEQVNARLRDWLETIAIAG